MALAEQERTQINEETLLTVTPSAVTIIRGLLEQREIPNHSLRVFVSGGGCSGMQYGMAFQEHADDGDYVMNVEDISLLIDPTSLVYLKGAAVDYVDTLIGGGFRIDNPNAVSSCGCGSSFRTNESEASAEDCGTCSY